jgi:hypothetical protein
MTATDLRAAIDTYEKNVNWMIANDEGYIAIVNMLALIGQLRDRLLATQRGTYGVGRTGAR